MGIPISTPAFADACKNGDTKCVDYLVKNKCIKIRKEDLSCMFVSGNDKFIRHLISNYKLNNRNLLDCLFEMDKYVCRYCSKYSSVPIDCCGHTKYLMPIQNAKEFYVKNSRFINKIVGILIHYNGTDVFDLVKKTIVKNGFSGVMEVLYKNSKCSAPATPFQKRVMRFEVNEILTKLSNMSDTHISDIIISFL
jgi:hypothetical protein